MNLFIKEILIKAFGPSRGLPQIQEEPPQQKEKDVAKELSPGLPLLGQKISQETSQRVDSMKRKVLVIPGPDEDRKKAVVLFLKKLDLEPLLVEGADGQGTDLSGKYEMYAEAAFAVTLLPGKDMGFPKEKPDKPKPHPPKDMMLELGFLMGLPGCVLYEEGLDLPCGGKGICLIPYDAGGLWKLLLARRMKMARVDVDLNKAV